MVSITLRIPYGNFWWNMLFTFVYRGPVIFLATLLIKQARRKFSTVEFSSNKTLGSQIYGTLFSTQFLKNSVFYIVSSYFIHGIFIFQLPFRYEYYLLSKEYRKSPLINDQWVYFWFYPFFLAVFYSGHQLIFQRNKLSFQYGPTKTAPDDSLLTKLPLLFGNALTLNVFMSIWAPVTYYFVRPIIYKSNILLILVLGLDTAVPKLGITLKSSITMAFLSYHILLVWEIVNHAYNVYATIGCLDGKKPISTYSSDPINTLLSGLRNVDPEQQLCRLTAFQELAYLATTSEPEGVKLRTAIYNARSRRGFVWPAILDECSLIIKEITAAINYRSTSDLHTLRQKQIQIKQELSGSSIGRTVDDSDIFGNSFITSPIKSNSPGIQTYSEAKQPKKSLLDSYWYQLIEKQAIKPLQKLVSNLVSGKKSSNSTFAPIKNILVRIENTCLIYNERFLSSSGGLLFRTTLKRDTESRVVNAVSFGNAVIAISNLLIHSIEEDKNSTVTNNHIRDILELLEKPVRATSNYTDYLPASIILSTRQRENPKLIKNHLVAVMHDLCMHEFFQICVRFNFKLNDLVLNPRTYKLAKWVIDVAIAQQQQNHQKVANY